MGTVIGPVLRRADAYGFDTWTAGKGVTRGYPYRRIEDAHYARNADIKASAQGRGRDRLPDPRRVHREIYRVRDACRLTGFARQSRHLQVDAGVTRAVKFPPLPQRSRQVACRASVKALGLETLWPALMWVSTPATPSSVSVEPIYTLSNAPRTLEG